jgi:hypothetical protein
VIAAMLVAGGYWLATILTLILAARFGVVSLHVRRPPKPRNRPEVKA